MPTEIHPKIKKLYDTGDNVMEQWLNSLSLPDLPSETKKLLKQLVFFKSDIEKEYVDFATLPTNAPLSNISKHKNVCFSSYVQAYFGKYIHSLVSKLYQYNPDILGEKQISINTELILNPKSKRIVEVKYTQRPIRLSVNAQEFNTSIQNEDTLVFVLAHELMHLTLREKYHWINEGKTEESLCDVMALVCMARAGYRPVEAALWSINQAPEYWYLAEYVNKNEIPVNPNPEEKLFFSEAQYIGLVNLSEEDKEYLEPEREFMFQLGVHPHPLIRGIYLTKINNYLIENNCISADENHEKTTPLDSVFLKLLDDAKQKKIPVYPKKSSLKIKMQQKKQHQKT